MRPSYSSSVGVSYPSARYNMYLNGNYELNDNLGVFLTGLFSKSNSHTVQEPAPVTG